MCNDRGFNHISNDNITSSYVSEVGVHLLNSGSDLLVDNFVYYINSNRYNTSWQLDNLTFTSSNVLNELSSSEIDEAYDFDTLKKLRIRNVNRLLIDNLIFENQDNMFMK